MIKCEFGLLIDVVVLMVVVFVDLLFECLVELDKGNMLYVFVFFGFYDLDKDKVVELKCDSD